MLHSTIYLCSHSLKDKEPNSFKNLETIHFSDGSTIGLNNLLKIDKWCKVIIIIISTHVLDIFLFEPGSVWYECTTEKRTRSHGNGGSKNQENSQCDVYHLLSY